MSLGSSSVSSIAFSPLSQDFCGVSREEVGVPKKTTLLSRMYEDKDIIAVSQHFFEERFRSGAADLNEQRRSEFEDEHRPMPPYELAHATRKGGGGIAKRLPQANSPSPPFAQGGNGADTPKTE